MIRYVPSLGAFALGGLLLAACSSGSSTPTAPLGAPQSTANTQASDAAFEASFPSDGAYHSACGVAPPGAMRCFALVRDDIGNKGVDLLRDASPLVVGGYGPSDLQSAYNLNTSGGSGQTVAIVDAFNDPNAESDLAVYRSHFGLSACTTAGGCFRKVNQTGGTSYPPNDVGWSEEISLDVDMVSANCPNCHILLVEANSNSLANLETAVNEAATLGANAISNSYGGGESSGEDNNGAYNHPGAAVTASNGDSGFGPQFPAASKYLTAVGGTSLKHSSNSRGWAEKVWPGTGSGCSQFVAKPAWQLDTGCAKRTIGDVAYDAAPGTGVAVYDSFGVGGWLVFGGTSVGSPAIAAIYALAGNAGSVNAGSYSYSHTSSLFDITKGNNGSCGNYLCHGEVGYDGPTGNGTPNGTGGF